MFVHVLMLDFRTLRMAIGFSSIEFKILGTAPDNVLVDTGTFSEFPSI